MLARRIRDLGNEQPKLIVFLSAAHALDLTLILIFTFTLTLIYDLCSSVILSVNAGGNYSPWLLRNREQSKLHHSQKTQDTHRFSREYLNQEDCM